jgi:hypothetical protein
VLRADGASRSAAFADADALRLASSDVSFVEFRAIPICTLEQLQYLPRLLFVRSGNVHVADTNFFTLLVWEMPDVRRIRALWLGDVF